MSFAWYEEEPEVVEEKTYVDGVEYIEVDGIKVVNICDLIDVLIPDYWGNVNYKWEETNKIIMEWCEKNNGWYYSDVREEFFVWRGVEDAKENNKTVVVTEDLS